MPLSAKTWNWNSGDHSVVEIDKRLYSNNTSLILIQQQFAHFKNRLRLMLEGRRKRDEGHGGGRFRSDLRSDLVVTRAKQRRFPWLCVEKFNPCMFEYAAKLTSCSSMAVDVEAEASATKRSQVEVTKILPEWMDGRKTTKKKKNQNCDSKVVTLLFQRENITTKKLNKKTDVHNYQATG